MLIPDHYTVLSHEGNAESGVVLVRLNPDCPVYKGHFPGAPVSPGVCNIQMVLECANMLSGKTRHITAVQQCRMTSLIVPDGKTLTVQVALADGKLVGSITRGEEVCLTLKAEVEE